MKISESMVQLGPDHSAREWDRLTLETEARSRRVQTSVSRPSVFGTWNNRVRMDRVSIDTSAREEVRSSYSAAVTSESRVRLGDGSTETFARESMIQSLVKGVLGRDVAVGKMETPGLSVTEQRPVMTAGATAVDTLAWIRETRVHYEQEQLGFSSLGQVKTSDGRIIDFSLDLAMDRSMLSKTVQETLISTWQEEVTLTDPLVISLDGQPPRLTDTWFAFDLDADGTTEEISFVSEGSGFLAFDRNLDGRVNNGSELFGPGTGNGFEELAMYDSDMNGWIDENDAVFSKLSVWTRDSGGEDRLVSLKEAGLGAIYLGSVATPFDLRGGGNEILGQAAASGVFLFENGNVGMVQEIDLAVRQGTDSSRSGTIASPEPWQPAFPLASGFRMPEISVENPFQVLMDELAALREEMRRLLEGRSEFSGRRRLGAADYRQYQSVGLTLLSRPGTGIGSFWRG